MKRALPILILILLAVGAILLWKRGHKEEAKPAEEAKTEEEGSRVTHDESGHVIIKMDDETQGNIGLLVEKPAAGQLSPELKAYGKVQDPAPLAALVTDLAAAEAAAAASIKEFNRLKTLAGQGNASESKLQITEAQAMRDQITVRALREKLMLSWGKAVAEQTNLTTFVEPLAVLAAALVRLDLLADQSLPARPIGARITTLSGKSGDARYLGATANVDPQTLGRGVIFLVHPNTAGMVAGEVVTGFIELEGEPLSGVIVPSSAVVRTEGRGWIYIMGTGGDTFVRTEISFDHSTQGGWLVSSGVSTNDYVVVTGAQTLLSEEMKASLKAD